MSSLDFIPDTSLVLKQDKRYRMTSDTLHLARFMTIRKHDTILDVGTNNGVLALYASLKTQRMCTGLDIDASSIDLANENARLNNRDNLHFEVSSVQTYQSEAMDVVVCNPPYFRQEESHQNAMEFDGSLSLDDLAKHSARLLKDKGRLYIIIKSIRFIETLDLFKKHHLAIKRIQMIHHTKDHAASSVCIEAMKNGKSNVIIEAPIIQKDSNT